MVRDVLPSQPPISLAGALSPPWRNTDQSDWVHSRLAESPKQKVPAHSFYIKIQELMKQLLDKYSNKFQIIVHVFMKEYYPIK